MTDEKAPALTARVVLRDALMIPGHKKAVDSFDFPRDGELTVNVGGVDIITQGWIVSIPSANIKGVYQRILEPHQSAPAPAAPARPRTKPAKKRSRKRTPRKRA